MKLTPVSSPQRASALLDGGEVVGAGATGVQDRCTGQVYRTGVQDRCTGPRGLGLEVSQRDCLCTDDKTVRFSLRDIHNKKRTVQE